jgi:hypothetical protein
LYKFVIFEIFVVEESIRNFSKVNNLLNSGSIVGLLQKIMMHNTIFPDTAYSFYGFAGFDGRTVQPIIVQPRVANAHPATQIMIDTYMAALGFEKAADEGRLRIHEIVLTDEEAAKLGIRFLEPYHRIEMIQNRFSLHDEPGVTNKNKDWRSLRPASRPNKNKGETNYSFF